MIRFAAVSCSIVWLLVFSTGILRGAEGSREQPNTIRIAYVSPVTTMAPIWIATEIGAYRREGLDARIIYIDARVAVAALVAGEVDTIVISAPSVIPPVLSGANIAFIAGLHNKMIFSFHAQPDIKNAEQLRGKVVGTNRPGTPADYGNRVALTKMGLKPSDVQLLPLGSSGVMWQALQTRQVAGVTLAPPYSFQSGRVEVFAACRYLRSALPEHRRCGSERPNPTHGRYLAPLAESPAAGKSTLVRRPEARHARAAEVHAAIRSRRAPENLRFRDEPARLYQRSQGLGHRPSRHPRFSRGDRASRRGKSSAQRTSTIQRSWSVLKNRRAQTVKPWS